MKKLSKALGSLKLNQKFTLVIFSVVMVPVVLLAWMQFANTRNLLMSDRAEDVEDRLTQLGTDVNKAVELCNMTTQVIINSPGLLEFLEKAKTGQPVSSEEMLVFTRSDIAAIEKIVTSNPHMYQARVYFQNESLPEVTPVLYHQSRMERLAWAGAGEVADGWRFDYPDTIFSPVVAKPNPHIMSLVTVIEDYEYGALGVLEVAIRMDEVMPGLYAEAADGYSCYVAADGQVHTGKAGQDFWQDNLSAALGMIEGGAGQEADFGGEAYWLAAAELDTLGGRYITAAPMGDIIGKINARRGVFLLATFAALLALAFAVNLIVKAMLRRFYRIVDAIERVKLEGGTPAVPEDGNDEMGLLGRQINAMMDRIGELVQENINRQLLVKNSEIKALQSQINAHFIYNVLESVKMMAEVEERYEIADAITSLGQLLRYSMRFTPGNVPLNEEVENVENYLRLINLRFDYRVTLEVVLPPDILQQGVPKLTLQPLVENAVVHGAEPLGEDTVVRMRCTPRPEGYCLEIIDGGRGMDAAEAVALNERLAGATEGGSDAGIGLKNVQDRIVNAFGEPYGIRVSPGPGRGAAISILLPYTHSPEAESEKVANR